MNELKTDLTIIICCYNSAHRIKPTLEHIANQLLGGILLEVILINNNCTDNTVAVALAVWAECKNPFPLKVIEERKSGLSNARKAGVEAADGEIIIFCDDDNWLEPNYVYNSFNILNSNPKIGAAGGQSSAISDSSFPDWWESYKNGYAIGKQASDTRDTTKRLALWGAGMVTRKNIFIRAFPSKHPSLLIDRQGNTLTAGGDSEYVMRLVILGYKLYNDNSLIFQHFIPAERLTADYRDRLFEGFEKSRGILEAYVKQATITMLKNHQKPGFLLKCIIKYFCSKIIGHTKWNIKYETLMIYHLTGIRLMKISQEDLLVREICISLKNNSDV